MKDQLTNEELRSIILGKRVYKKCPCCDNNGIYYLNEEGESASSPLQEWGDDYSREECDNCDGLGFVIAIYEDE